ncbi:unnamed protein product [Phyllotreta striolata]|uniref:Uncharacterized protein n=1 Tax=Phyllotreta striolata TaxID=444603 RepID=A0A9N9TK14_PHYSR|nr:unnamed protein product [Phyllotreta striolata]
MDKFCFVACILIFGVAAQLDIFRPKTIRFNVFKGRCPDYPKAPIYLSNVQLNNINRTFYVSLKVHVTKNIDSDDLKLELHLKRCASSDALDSCENYNTIKLNHFCKMLDAEDKPWTPFRKYFHPPSTGCPLRKGEHSIKNGTFDGSAFSRIPINNFYWKVTVHLITVPQDEVVMCNQVEGQIAPI